MHRCGVLGCDCRPLPAKVWPPWDVLNISPSDALSRTAIQDAFNAKADLLHPSLNAACIPLAASNLQAAKRARDTLMILSDVSSKHAADLRDHTQPVFHGFPSLDGTLASKRLDTHVNRLHEADEPWSEIDEPDCRPGSPQSLFGGVCRLVKHLFARTTERFTLKGWWTWAKGAAAEVVRAPLLVVQFASQHATLLSLILALSLVLLK